MGHAVLSHHLRTRQQQLNYTPHDMLTDLEILRNKCKIKTNVAEKGATVKFVSIIYTTLPDKN